MATPRARAVPVRVRVAVASDQALIAEAVVTALRSRGLDALLVRWPQQEPDAVATARERRSPRRSAGRPPDVGLVLSDLARVEQVHGAQAVVEGLPIPWLVLAGVEEGPAWGGLYERGAQLVVPDATGLDAVVGLLGDLVSGEQSTASTWQQRGERRDLVERWRSFADERDRLTARLRTLTEREEEVLHDLHDGLGVRAIAQQSEVAEATVRSHVKAILKKLDVGSQMAAVAAYEDVVTDTTLARDEPTQRG
jgi:two-component system, NarL family, nitrate/nitrite response regulator NarL